MTTIGQLVREGRDQLRAGGVEPPGRESSRLLGHLLGLGESQVLSRDVDAVPPEVEREFRALLARRRAGEPMAYLTGEREFYGRSFRVDGRVLIPRPETEHLVELALASVGADPARVLDVGTGSGCVAVTLAAERPRWRVLATDLSLAALAVARDNALRHGVSARVRLAAADLTAGLTRAALGGLDLVVGNLPYVEERVVPHLSVDVRDY
jgi:release factor glutamine methyltransferase